MPGSERSDSPELNVVRYDIRIATDQVISMLFYLIVIVVAIANLALGYAAAHHLGYAGNTAGPKYFVEPTSDDAADSSRQ